MSLLVAVSLVEAVRPGPLLLLTQLAWCTAAERPLTAMEVAQEGAVLTEFSLIMRKLLGSVERKAQTMAPVPVRAVPGPVRGQRPVGELQCKLWCLGFGLQAAAVR